jgi:hypothetical protein
MTGDELIVALQNLTPEQRQQKVCAYFADGHRILVRGVTLDDTWLWMDLDMKTHPVVALKGTFEVRQ